MDISISNVISSSLRAIGSRVLRMATRSLVNAGLGAIFGSIFGGIDTWLGGGDWGDIKAGMIAGGTIGAALGLIPGWFWRSPVGVALAVTMALRGVFDALGNGNIAQALFRSIGVVFPIWLRARTQTPKKLYIYVPKNMTRVIGGSNRSVNINTIRTQGYKPGVGGSVWATKMSPKEFNSLLIGGRRGVDVSGGKISSFFKSYEQGYVIKVNNTQGFKASGTHWKALIGQYECQTTVKPQDMTIFPFGSQ